MSGYKPHRQGLHSDDKPYVGEPLCYCDKPKATSSDTSELEDILKFFELFFVSEADVNNGRQLTIKKLEQLIATKVAEAYKAGMVKEASRRLTDAVDRMRKLDKDAMNEFLSELKSDMIEPLSKNPSPSEGLKKLKLSSKPGPVCSECHTPYGGHLNDCKELCKIGVKE